MSTLVVVLVVLACADDGTKPLLPEQSDTAQVITSIGFNGQAMYIDSLDVTRPLVARAYREDGRRVYTSVDYPDRFTWSSSASGVVSVDPAGAISVHGWGRATVTVVHEGGLTGEMRVTARDAIGSGRAVSLGAGVIRSGISIGADGTAYAAVVDFSSRSSRLVALSPAGGVLWELPVASQSDGAKPAIGEDGTIYLATWSSCGQSCYTGSLTAVDPGGFVRWVLEDLDDFHASPSVGPDGTIHVAGGNHVYAVEPTGEIRWAFEADDDVFVHSAPATARDGTVYVGGADGDVYAIGSDGSLLWTFSTRDIVQSSPAIGADGTIYVGSQDGRLYAIDREGSERWSVELDWRGIGTSSPSIGADGTIYVGGGGAFAVDPAGGILWNYSPNLWVVSSPILGADGTVYVATSGALFALDAAGWLLWEYRTGARPGTSSFGSPAIGIDGRILATSFSTSIDRSSEGVFHVIVENGSANGGHTGAVWPQERGRWANSGRAGG